MKSQDNTGGMKGRNREQHHYRVVPKDTIKTSAKQYT